MAHVSVPPPQITTPAKSLRHSVLTWQPLEVWVLIRFDRQVRITLRDTFLVLKKHCARWHSIPAVWSPRRKLYVHTIRTQMVHRVQKRTYGHTVGCVCIKATLLRTPPFGWGIITHPPGHSPQWLPSLPWNKETPGWDAFCHRREAERRCKPPSRCVGRVLRLGRKEGMQKRIDLDGDYVGKSGKV